MPELQSQLTPSLHHPALHLYFPTVSKVLLTTALYVSSALPAIAQSDPCKSAHSDQKSCDADKTTGGGCVWCKCEALPSSCWTVANSKKLPPAVYKCDSPSVEASLSIPEEEPKYTRIPFGREVLSHCLHEIPSGSHSYAQPDGSTKVVAPDGSVIMIPKCVGKNGADHPVFRFPGKNNVAKTEHTGMLDATGGPLPPDYDGWLSYTSLNVTDVGKKGGFDSFTSTMSVPDKPKGTPQVLYFFPGLQNRDWIPKVDPLPTDDDPFDIIQPVLQYPGGFLNRGWELKSWYVTINAGALFSSGLKVKEGDAILCNMTRTGTDSWIVKGQVGDKVQSQSATNADRLKVQPWAYSAVTECYGCDGCDTFPTKPITFTDNKLYQDGELVKVQGSDWVVNAKPPVKYECHEKTVVASNGDATTSFQ